MYIASSKQILQLQSDVLTLNTDNNNIYEELEKNQIYHQQTDDLRTLQMIERNYLLRELSDQLVTVRKKLSVGQYNVARNKSLSYDESINSHEKLEKKEKQDKGSHSKSTVRDNLS